MCGELTHPASWRTICKGFAWLGNALAGEGHEQNRWKAATVSIGQLSVAHGNQIRICLHFSLSLALHFLKLNNQLCLYYSHSLQLLHAFCDPSTNPECVFFSIFILFHPFILVKQFSPFFFSISLLSFVFSVLSFYFLISSPFALISFWSSSTPSFLSIFSHVFPSSWPHFPLRSLIFAFAN